MLLKDFSVDIEASASISDIKHPSLPKFQDVVASLPLTITRLLGEIEELEGRIRHLSAEETLHLITLCHRAANEIQLASLEREIQTLYVQQTSTPVAVNAPSPQTSPQIPGF
jgi:hypothetical protein